MTQVRSLHIQVVFKTYGKPYMEVLPEETRFRLASEASYIMCNVLKQI